MSATTGLDFCAVAFDEAGHIYDLHILPTARLAYQRARWFARWERRCRRMNGPREPGASAVRVVHAPMQTDGLTSWAISERTLYLEQVA
jgi:hypothetical protein